ncbi:MAG: recombinase family protein [Alphaproteobacteria bacterium]|nr:recombinase family protein [Alphaproteobacteria bacterium]
MKAVILTRVSSKEQEDGHSLAAQNTRLIEYAKRKNLEVIKSYQIIESSTHGKRKEFTEMLNFCKRQKETIAIIADAVDRVQRSFKESVLLDELVRKEKLELHFYREGMIIGKNANANDIMRWDFAVMGAKTYVLQLSENVKRSMEYKVKNGEFTSQAPIGYLNYINENNKKFIKIDEINGPKVKKLFETYSLGHSSLHEIRTIADNIGLKSHRGKRIAISSLQRMLTNPFYYGIMQIKGKEIPHIYPPLISKELWDRCEEVRKGSVKKPYKYSDKPFLYRGLIRCAVTGKICTNETKKERFNYIVTYSLEGKRKYIAEKDIDDQIIAILRTLKFPQKRMEEIRAYNKTAKQAEIEYRNREVGVLQSSLTKTTDRLDKLVNLYLDGEIEKEIFEFKKEKLQTEKKLIKNRIEAHTIADDSFNNLICELAEISRNAYDLFDLSSNYDLKRNLLKMIFRTLEIKDGNLGYTLNFPFNKMQNLNTIPEWSG